MQSIINFEHQFTELNAFQFGETKVKEEKEGKTHLLEQLQTTLDLEKLLSIFAKEASKYADFSGLYFKKDDISASTPGSSRGKAERQFELRANNEFIGLLTYTLKKPISLSHFHNLKALHKLLVYPIRNALEYKKAMSLAMQDGLTNLGNRRYFDEQLKRAMHHANRHNHHVGLIIGDLNKFKAINDTHGHLVGDECLIHLAKKIKLCLRRSTDIGCRYGGEEFCLILPETDEAGAKALAEELRILICTEAVKHQGMTIDLTVSCGITTYKHQAECTTDSLFDAADKGLYLAKENGRNQVQVYDLNELLYPREQEE